MPIIAELPRNDTRPIRARTELARVAIRQMEVQLAVSADSPVQHQFRLTTIRVEAGNDEAQPRLPGVMICTYQLTGAEDTVGFGRSCRLAIEEQIGEDATAECAGDDMCPLARH